MQNTTPTPTFLYRERAVSCIQATWLWNSSFSLLFIYFFNFFYYIPVSFIFHGCSIESHLLSYDCWCLHITNSLDFYWCVVTEFSCTVNRYMTDATVQLWSLFDDTDLNDEPKNCNTTSNMKNTCEASSTYYTYSWTELAYWQTLAGLSLFVFKDERDTLMFCLHTATGPIGSRKIKNRSTQSIWGYILI